MKNKTKPSSSKRVKKRTKPSASVDIKYLGIPNVCFSLTGPDDKREKKFKKQRLKRGFDDSETWSLRDSIARFIIPRLERYEEIANDFLKRDEKLTGGIQDFLTALKLMSRDSGTCDWTKEEEAQFIKGMDAFPKVFMSLWW